MNNKINNKDNKEKALQEVSRRISKDTLFVFMIAAVIALVISIKIFQKTTSYTDRKIYKCYVINSIKRKPIKCKISDKTYLLDKKDFAETLKPVIQKNNKKVVIFGVFYIPIVMLLFFLLRKLIGNKYTDKFKSEHVRGSKKAEPEEVNRLLDKNKEKSDIKIANLHIIKNSETMHFTISGTTGQGKGVTIHEIIDQAEEKQEKILGYCPAGEFVEAHHKEGDIILNPLDKRGAYWNLFDEIETEFDVTEFVHSIIPMPPDAKDRYWIDAPRSVLESTILKMRKEGIKDCQRLYERVVLEGYESLYKFLEGTKGAKHIDPANEKTATAVMSSLEPYMECFRFLKKPKYKTESFSLKKWVGDDTDKRNVFIRIDQNQLNGLKPLISLWFDIAIVKNLSIQPSYTRRIWYILDELSTLNKLNRLKDILDKGRKYGACVVLGYQAFSQLKEVYGENGATSLISNTNTWFIFKSPEAKTAKWLSENIGHEETLEAKGSESDSFGKENSRSSSINYSIEKRDVVMPEEILTLDKLNCFVKLAGNYPVTKIKLTPKNRPKIAEKYIPL